MCDFIVIRYGVGRASFTASASILTLKSFQWHSLDVSSPGNHNHRSFILDQVDFCLLVLIWQYLCLARCSELLLHCHKLLQHDISHRFIAGEKVSQTCLAFSQGIPLVRELAFIQASQLTQLQFKHSICLATTEAESRIVFIHESCTSSGLIKRISYNFNHLICIIKCHQQTIHNVDSILHLIQLEDAFVAYSLKSKVEKTIQSLAQCESLRHRSTSKQGQEITRKCSL
mmetsp:Transcript_13549/g.32812  ORF Transcript_13549/g.32812 Transcript_13549/m.32812 type:complete len:229 (-) Transcript_13549:1155-1841(-)